MTHIKPRRLLGPDGVLPRGITMQVAEFAQAHQQTAPQDFFRIFETAAAQLQRRSGEIPPDGPQPSSAVAALTGMIGGMLPDNAVCYQGVPLTLGGNVRLRALNRLAAYYFGGRVTVAYAPPQRVFCTPPPGRENVLGGGAMPGRRCLTQGNRLRVTLTAGSLNDYDDYGPGSDGERLIDRFLRTFSRRLLFRQIVIRPGPRLMAPAHLGSPRSALGRNTLLPPRNHA